MGGTAADTPIVGLKDPLRSFSPTRPSQDRPDSQDTLKPRVISARPAGSARPLLRGEWFEAGRKTSFLGCCL